MPADVTRLEHTAVKRHWLDPAPDQLALLGPNFRPDAAAGPGDKYALAGKEPLQFRRVQVDRRPPQQRRQVRRASRRGLARRWPCRPAGGSQGLLGSRQLRRLRPEKRQYAPHRLHYRRADARGMSGPSAWLRWLLTQPPCATSPEMSRKIRGFGAGVKVALRGRVPAPTARRGSLPARRSSVFLVRPARASVPGTA
jgi:hypothetical protein